MSLTQKSRSEIYRALSELGTDPDAVEELLSHFPSRDLDEAVTKEFHRAETAALRTDVRAEIAELRTEMHVGFADIRTEMHQGFQRMTLSLAALMVSMTGVTVAALTIAR